ncbi:MAG TPA: hypothetical protein VG711_05525 [Phycisphaerales bacterium]|nr:hypothetical protein [Phycisphaerales bacterium]
MADFQERIFGKLAAIITCIALVLLLFVAWELRSLWNKPTTTPGGSGISLAPNKTARSGYFPPWLRDHSIQGESIDQEESFNGGVAEDADEVDSDDPGQAHVQRDHSEVMQASLTHRGIGDTGLSGTEGSSFGSAVIIDEDAENLRITRSRILETLHAAREAMGGDEAMRKGMKAVVLIKSKFSRVLEFTASRDARTAMNIRVDEDSDSTEPELGDVKLQYFQKDGDSRQIVLPKWVEEINGSLQMSYLASDGGPNNLWFSGENHFSVNDLVSQSLNVLVNIDPLMWDVQDSMLEGEDVTASFDAYADYEGVPALEVEISRANLRLSVFYDPATGLPIAMRQEHDFQSDDKVHTLPLEWKVRRWKSIEGLRYVSEAELNRSSHYTFKYLRVGLEKDAIFGAMADQMPDVVRERVKDVFQTKPGKNDVEGQALRDWAEAMFPSWLREKLFH